MANTHSLDLELSSSQYAGITDGSQTGLDLSSDFTVEGWVKPESSVSQMVIVSKVDDFVTKESYWVYMSSDNTISVEFSSDGSSAVGSKTTIDSVDTYPDGVWTHFAVSVDISVPSAIFYKNGVAGSVTNTNLNATTIFDSTSDFKVGSQGSTPAGFFDGRVDDIRVWNDIRTATEILDNYLKELQGNESGLVGYWKFNNNYLDETSNNNDLTASGSPVFIADTPFTNGGAFLLNLV